MRKRLWRKPDVCSICGPGEYKHSICHPIPGLSRNGCGHSLDDHTPSLKCRICKVECGIDCTRSVRDGDQVRADS